MSNHAATDYDIFRAQYKKVVKQSDMAILMESNGNKLEAFTLYKTIIIELENVMAINVSSAESCVREDIRNKKKNLKWLRNNIYDCIERLRSVKGLGCAGRSANLVFSVPQDCQNHIIDNASGAVRASPAGSLEVFQFAEAKYNTRGFLIVSDWMAPLMRDVTPVLLTPEGALVFFDVDRHCKVVVTLPCGIHPDEYKRFITVLSSLSLLVMDDKIVPIPSDSRRSTGDTIAKGVEKVTEVISYGIVTGTAKLSELINESSKNYCQNTTVTDIDVPVNPNVKSGLEYARKGSHCLVEVSGKAFEMLIRSTQFLASKAAPHIKSAADNVIPSEWKKAGENGEKSTVDQVAVVTGATLNGFSKLCSSLHDGAVMFGRNFARDTTNMVTHRYGGEVGRTTEHALYSAGNLGLTAFTAMTFSKKGIIKTAAQISALEIASEYNKGNGGQIKEAEKVQNTQQ